MPLIGPNIQKSQKIGKALATQAAGLLVDTYSGPPFISNIRPEIQQELNDRAKNRLRPITPFIKATPGFTFYKGYKGKPLFKGIADQIPGKEPWQFSMRDLYKSQNAFRPVAGVTGLTIEYKNVVGTVRKAALSWVCHSLADLEKLGPFFLNPGRTLLIEWGWNEYRDENNNTHGGTPYLDTTDKYEGINVKNYYAITQQYVINSHGNYEGMLGVIVNYDISMNADGGFTCVTHVTSTGDLMAAMSLTQQHFVDPNLVSAKDSDKPKGAPLTLRQYIDDWIDADLKIQLAGQENKDVAVVNNFPKEDVMIVRFKNRTDNDRSGIFLSWGYIEDNVLGPYIPYKTPNDGKLVIYDSSKSRIRTHEFLRSTDLDFCIIPYQNPGANKQINYFPPFELIDSSDQKRYANPRRIMINLDFLKNIFVHAKTVDDGIATIFGKVNDACANLWRFAIRTRDEFNTDEGALCVKEVIDLNFTDKKIPTSDGKPVLREPYTFRIKSFNLSKKGQITRVTGIIRAINITTKLSNDAALNVYFAANSSKDEGVVPGNENVLHSLWNYGIVGRTPDDDFLPTPFTAPPSQLGTSPTQKQIDARKSVEEEKAKKEKTEVTAEGDQHAWPDELKKFLPLEKYGWRPNLGGVIADTIDKGREMMKSAAFLRSIGVTPSTFEAVVPIHAEIELEGISGVRPGDVFNVDNLPEMYKKKGVFQVVGISHEVSRETWKTKLKASYRVQRTEDIANPPPSQQPKVV